MKRSILLLVFALLALSAVAAQAATYTFPGGALPSGCTRSGSTINCPGNVIFGNNDIVIVTSPTQWFIGGDFTFANGLRINQDGPTNNLTLTISQNMNSGNNGIINANLIVLGNINNTNNSQITGGLTVSGNLVLGNNSVINGPINVTGTLNTGENVIINGNISAASANIGQNNVITGNIEAVNVNVNGGGTVIDGNINATGSVNLQGTVTGYVNAPVINNNGATVQGPTCDLNQNVGGCNGGPAPQISYYQIEQPGSALTCQAVPVIVTACASAGCASAVTTSGSVSITAQGPATFGATAAFGGASSVTVLLDITVPGTYVLSVSGASEPAANGYQCLGSCDLLAQDTALDFSQIPPQSAGVPFHTTISIVKADERTGACQTVAAQVTQMAVSVECVDPGVCTDQGARLFANGTSVREWPSQVPVNISFDTQAQTLMGLNYLDAGKIRIRALVQTAQGALISGASLPFVVRPARIEIDVSSPAAYTGGVFAKAGDPLVVILRAVTDQGVVTPNFGNEMLPAHLVLHDQAVTVTPVGGVNGEVVTGDSFVRVSAGVYASADVRYAEAGTARFVAKVEGDDYLGTGALQSFLEIGRFIPWDYDVLPVSLTRGCEAGEDSFTYLDQPVRFSATVYAQNWQGNRMLNYPDVGAGVSVALVGAEIDGELSLNDRINERSHSPVWQNGVGILSSREFLLSKVSPSDGESPLEQVVLGLTIDGASVEEAVYGRIHQSDFSDGELDCEAQGSCYAKRLAEPGRFVYGRLLLHNTYGSEFDAAPVSVEAQIYDGSRFLTHGADNCTLISYGNLELVDLPFEVTSVPIGLPGPLALESGKNIAGSVMISPPGIQTDIQMRYLAPAWLQIGSPPQENPTAYATFGVYGGHDRVISWREVFNGPSGN